VLELREDILREHRHTFILDSNIVAPPSTKWVEEEVEALRELAAADPAERLAFAGKLRTERGLAARFSGRAELLTRSLVGTNLRFRERLIEHVIAAPLPANAHPVVQQAVALLGASLETPRAIGPFLKSIAATSDSNQLGALGQGLEALRVELTAEQAARAIDPFLKSIAATTGPYQLRALGQGLTALADRV